jgi:hypothetical protein
MVRLCPCSPRWVSLRTAVIGPLDPPLWRRAYPIKLRAFSKAALLEAHFWAGFDSPALPGVVRSCRLRRRPPTKLRHRRRYRGRITSLLLFTRVHIPKKSQRHRPSRSQLRLTVQQSWHSCNKSLARGNSSNLCKSDRPSPRTPTTDESSTASARYTPIRLHQPSLNVLASVLKTIIHTPIAGFGPQPSAMFTSKGGHKISRIGGITPSIFREA